MAFKIFQDMKINQTMHVIDREVIQKVICISDFKERNSNSLIPHPFNVAAVPDGDVGGAAGVESVIVNPVGALVGVHVAQEHEVHSVLVQHGLHLLLEALHLLVMGLVGVVAADSKLRRLPVNTQLTNYSPLIIPFCQCLLAYWTLQA